MWNLRNRLLVPILIATVLGLGLSSVASHFMARNILHSTIKSDAMGSVRSLSEIITLIFLSAISDAEQVARTLQACDVLNNPDDASKIPPFLSMMGALSKSKPYYQLGIILDKNGIVLATTASAGMGSSRADRSYFKEAMQGKTVISDPILARTTNTSVIIICTPVLENNEIIGAVFFSVDLNLLSDMYIKDITLGEYGHALVLTRKGETVAHRDAKLIMSEEQRDAPVAKKIPTLTDVSGSFVSSHNGREVVYFYQQDPLTKWYCLLSAEQDDIDSPVLYLSKVSAAIGMAVAVLITLVVFVVVRTIVNALNQGVHFAEAVAKGNLDKTLSVERNDEIGVLCRALRVMVANLKEMIATSTQKSEEASEQSSKATAAMLEAEEARKTAERARSEGMRQAGERLALIAGKIQDKAENLIENVTHAENGAANQQSHATANATAMGEMNASVLGVAKDASSAAGSAEETRSNAAEGAKIVEDVVHSIGDVALKTSNLKNNLNQLGERANGIGQIMGVISDIADQTNLLALNAAIEAARAGDAGRGFAVVADEVRKLAEKTMQATKEVDEAVKAIQVETRGSIKGMEETSASVGKSTEMAQQAGTSLRAIVEIAQSTADKVRSIATASEEQSAASEEINQGTAQINEIAEETTALMRHARDEMLSLRALVEEIQNLVKELQNA